MTSFKLLGVEHLERASIESGSLHPEYLIWAIEDAVTKVSHRHSEKLNKGSLVVKYSALNRGEFRSIEYHNSSNLYPKDVQELRGLILTEISAEMQYYVDLKQEGQAK